MLKLKLDLTGLLYLDTSALVIDLLQFSSTMKEHKVSSTDDQCIRQLSIISYLEHNFLHKHTTKMCHHLTLFENCDLGNGEGHIKGKGYAPKLLTMPNTGHPDSCI